MHTFFIEYEKKFGVNTGETSGVTWQTPVYQFYNIWYQVNLYGFLLKYHTENACTHVVHGLLQTINFYLDHNWSVIRELPHFYIQVKEKFDYRQ